MTSTTKFHLSNLLSVLVVILVPIILPLTAIRIVINHWFPEVEYRMPGFPSDPYGFTFNERMEYAHYAIEYLRNDADISYLGDLKFPDGEKAPWQSCQFMEDCTKFYNDRELQHMLDVKNVAMAARNIWLILLVVLVVLGILAWRGGWGGSFRDALSLGGWLTLGLMGVLAVAVLLLFDWLFVIFHRIFFQGNTWIFYNSDSLIRLFPERFWSDAFLWVGGLTALMALALGLLFRNKKGNLKEGENESDG